MLKMLAGCVFFVHAAMCVVSFLFVVAVVPETKGETPDEIEPGWVKRGPLEASDG